MVMGNENYRLQVTREKIKHRTGTREEERGNRKREASSVQYYNRVTTRRKQQQQQQQANDCRNHYPKTQEKNKQA